MRATAWLGPLCAICLLSACAAGGNDPSGGSPGSGGPGGAPGTGGGGAGAGGSASTSTGPGPGSGGGTFDAGVPPEGEVYGHSPLTLFKLEPVSKTVTTVGNFDCLNIIYPQLDPNQGMWDIALDQDGNMVGSFRVYDQSLQQVGGLAQIDKVNAHCTVIKAGLYPNSLTFVPVGTVDPNKEVLVGFNVDQYVLIDPTTGDQTVIGNLNPNGTGQSWYSSGDVVSIINDKTYLTAKPVTDSGYAGPDTIVEIDPVTGTVLNVIGDTTYPKLWGLGYWGGTAYGFSATGQLCEIDLATGAGSGIPLMDVPPGLSFFGAGVTTSAPTEIPR